jgi:aldehyde dehydrogenase (NAD+)
MMSLTMLINGARTAGAEAMAVLNPATGETFARVPRCTDDELDRAVAAARAAFGSWRATPLEQRRRLLKAIGGVLADHRDELASLLTREQGKPLAEATIEVMAAAHWFAATADLPLPEVINEDSPKRLSRTVYEPLGVVAAIVPWNVPILQIGFKLPAALLTGNSLVLKPSPFTPVATLRLGELIADLLPPGVVNIVSGDDTLGPRLTAHPDIAKISFTGSTATGRRIMAAAADDLKRLTLELGGNDAAIVLPDIGIASAAKSIYWAAFRNSGQLCVAAKRVFVHDAVYDAFAEALDAYAASVRIGNGLDPDVQLGPMQNRPQFERVRDLIDETRAAGYRLVRDGGVIDGPGYFIAPMIVDNPPDAARLVAEEQFGPVLPLLRFRETDEAIERANASPYGLAATVWTRDLDRAAAVASRLEAGTVWVNEVFHFSPLAAFGGHKSSGIGSENGADGLKAYLQPKTIVLART